MTNTSLIIIGKIVAPHGVRGDVRVIPLTDFPDRFFSLKQVLLDDGTTLSVDVCRANNRHFLLKFRGFNDRNSTEKLLGKLLKVSRQDLVKLPEGHYYNFDIIGLKVFDDAGVYLGTITDILATGSNDVYVAEQEDKKNLLIPALKDVVKIIDVPGGRMVVKLQEEWE